MSIVDVAEAPTSPADPQPSYRPDALRLALIVLITVAALLGAGAVGWLMRGDGGSTTSTTESSVDAGFARDMSTHHTQAVIMAGYTRDTTTDPSVKNLALDIETSQTSQIGEMTGWLDSWGLSRSSSEPVMGWMSASSMAGMDMSTPSATATTAPGDTSLMPGMATPNQLDQLEKMTGSTLDVYFLQLMLRHHIAGVEMAQYAAAHAQHDYVRNIAQKMVDNQNSEITVMKQMLAARGAQPL
ncbi:MAG: hypothetical protein JWM76_5048 [Pseudonocardiales bacterium]|nr:hypothetical protein [Pseudonocardiales bacterium]